GPSGACGVTAPRRIFFVVDRRIIVDEAHERARRLAERLNGADRGILKTVADRLRRLADGGTTDASGERPLAVHALRGGMYRSEAWARNPLQPTIVASTVDQIGSRLLFRAYGRGSGTWPVYAGLIANDSLVFLDEAHCAQPFLQTLHAVKKYRSWAVAPIGRCFHAVVMSATPPPGAKDVFRDDSGQGRDPHHPLGRRQLASKPASLEKVTQVAATSASELPKALADAARGLVSEERRAIVVFANRVATARATKRLLAPVAETILLTGRMRPVDRDAVVERLKQSGLHSDESANRSLEHPIIVVATQTLEVGADLDFDGLVTECASLDALRQRFGRLNRMGRDIESRARIVIRADQAGPKPGDENDPVYGKALASTWHWLHEQKKANGEVDFGIAAMEKLLGTQEDRLAELNAPAAAAAVMLPGHVDCWAQTAPEPRPSPDVAPFLRGPQKGAPDVQVCWRADLDLSSDEGKEAAVASLALCPPSSGETLPVPIGAFKRWLAVGEDAEDSSADVPHADERGGAHGKTAAATLDCGPVAGRSVIRWRGRHTSENDITSTPNDIRPGDVIVIPTGHPGPWKHLGDLGLDESADPNLLDVGDRSHRLARAKPILRLHKALVSTWPNALPAKVAASALLEDLGSRHEQDPDEVAGALRDLLDALAASEAPAEWDWLMQAAGELAREFSAAGRLRREYQVIRGGCLVLAGRRRIEKLASEADAFGDEDDASASGTSHRDGGPVPLRSHLAGVEAFARRHAVGCGLPHELAEAVARAGLLHDLGKADPRFQSMLRGGSPWLVGTPFAKSAQLPKTRAARRRARESAGYPEGGRHELLSLRLAESAPALLPKDDDLRDLVLHLVASHHGHCRPFAPVVLDDEAPRVTFELDRNGKSHRMAWAGRTGLDRLDSGAADRYWRLIRLYGWWGLAWLEAMLRLADWRRSEWEEAHDA
ncbi:MAG: type I-U CRISPR-associated helicase/endonuclease Cas3, partial [Gammaproteobacteria bacterium]|nr:type I-U CRISPR-associated helicase/endonuclease Cas3 [Gammaproteobacteria bacterium]